MSAETFPYDVFLSPSPKDKAVACSSTLSASTGERAGVRIPRANVRAVNPRTGARSIAPRVSQVVRAERCSALRFMGRCRTFRRVERSRADGVKVWFDERVLKPSVPLRPSDWSGVRGEGGEAQGRAGF